MKDFSKFTKATLATGLLFIIYGYVCRAAGLNFFWESKSIGWAFILIGLIGLLSDRVRIKRKDKQKSIPEKIGIGVIIFILLVQTILISVIPFTDAFAVTKKYLLDNQELIDEVGQIEGFRLMPTGGIQKTTNSEGTYGAATINLTVKGQKKFKDVTVYVVKYVDQADWIVEGID